jgi:hypothetical protein
MSVVLDKYVLLLISRVHSARLLLHQSHFWAESKHKEVCNCGLGPIEISCRSVIDVATHFIANVDITDIESLACLVPYMVYQVVTVQDRLALEMKEEKGKHDQSRGVLMEMLWHFSKRWAIAGKYMIISITENNGHSS